MSTQNTRPPLFSQRALLIMTMSIIAGLIIGAATFAANTNPWTALIAGLGAAGVTLVALHGLVE